MDGTDKIIWHTEMSNVWDRLSQGNSHKVKSTDTFEFIHFKDLPLNQKTTYGSFVCNYKPLKSEPYRIRLMAGGDKLTYDQDTGSPVALLLEEKRL